MINARNIHDTFSFANVPSRSRADVKGLRRAIALAVVASAVFVGAALVANGQPSAVDHGIGTEGSYEVAYADLDTGRFGSMTDGFFAPEDEHELNDAWMGMRVISADGVELGYITDAFVNEDGSVDELVVEPVGDDTPLLAPVYLPARFAQLGEDAVTLSLGATQAAMALRPATDLAFLAE